MPPRNPSRAREFSRVLFEKTPASFGFLRRWLVLFLPGLGVWALRVAVSPLPMREAVAGIAALSVLTAWYAWVLPEPLVLGLLMGVGLASTPLASQAWAPGQEAWVAWVLFLGASLWTVTLKDARLALALWCPLWAVASIQLPWVGWAAILFAWVPPPVTRGRSAARWGALSVALCLFLLAFVRGGFAFPWSLWMAGGYDWLFPKGFVIPALLVWLALAYVGKKSPLPWWIGQIVGWSLAWGGVYFQGPTWMTSPSLGLLWLSAAGFGIAALQKNLLERRWHDKILWLSLILALWAAYR